MLKKIAQYTIVRRLGEGGMGTVYEAKEQLSDRLVALKVLRDDLDAKQEARRYFINEMRVLAQLDHRNIVRSLACLESEGGLVLVLEHLDGVTLRQLIRDHGSLHWREAASIGLEIAHALVAAHEHEPAVIHRDLKPENVMRLTDGSIKVMDFGIAKLMESLTATQSFLGTLQYMSPEQIDGLDLTPRADLYVLGLLLYELLAGKPPFESKSQRELFVMQCTMPPPALAVKMPRPLRDLLDQLLEKDPSARPPSAAEVVRRLSGTLSARGSFEQDKTATSQHSAVKHPTKSDEPPQDTLALIDEATKPKKTRIPVYLGATLLIAALFAGTL